MSVLALGDSYTIGEGVPERARWPVQLAALAARSGVPMAPARVIARTGWTTDELANAIGEASLRDRFDIVSLLIGVNDQYRGVAPEVYGSRFESLLECAIEFAGGAAPRVIVLSIPDWGVTPFAAGRDRRAIAEAIDAFNRENRTAALQRGARYVDVTTVSRTRGAEPEMLAPDGLHPSAAMYAEWSGLALPVLLGALAR